MVYFSIWDMHGFPHKFPTVRENATKLMVRGKPGKSITILFPWHGCFFPIQFPSYGILQHMRNAWVSPSIYHSAGKCYKTLRMGWTWEIGTHTFSIVWVIFSHPIPILCYTSSYGKCMGFPIISHSTGKCNKTLRMGWTWKIGTNTFPIVWVIFPHTISILRYTSSYGKCMRFPINFP